MATAADTFAPLMRDVAVALLGAPNKHLSNDKTLRWGTHGSLKVDLPDGVWHDKEANVGGGTIDLVIRERGCDKAGALAWLEGEGLIEPRPQQAGQPTFYEYADENGQVLFKVERKLKNGEKTFLQHGPDGRGGFVCRQGCMQGVRRVLYRLPELLASDPATIVFVCEGEKDADRLAKAGLIATTNPGGAGKFLAEFAPMLSGRRVVALQDNDKAGLDHCADVKAKLEGIAAEVAVLRLPGGDKSDVSDWLSNGGSAFDLHRRAVEALEKAGPDLLHSLDLATLAKTSARPVEFAIERVAPMGEVTFFTGPGSAGKSLLAQQLCSVSAAAIGSCIGLGVISGPAIYATCEDTAEHLHFRQERLCDALGVDMASLAGKLHLVSLRGELDNELEREDGKDGYAPSAAYHRLAATIKATGAKIVALDNVAHLFAGNENDRHDVTRFVNLLNRLARDTGAAILLIGHPNKSGDTYSGSTAWLNAVRSQVWLDALRDPEGHVLDQDTRILTIGKANYAPKGDGITFRWHQWAFVRDDDLPPNVGKQMAQNIQASADNLLFLACLRERTKQKRAVSEKRGPTYAPTEFAKMAESKGIGKKRLDLAMDRLFRINAIERADLWRGPDRKPVFGLRETAGNCAGNTVRETRETVPEATENRAGNAGGTHTVYKYIPGAAPQGSAAPDDGLDWGGVDSEDD